MKQNDLLRVENLCKSFPLGSRQTVRAVDGVSFAIRKGEIFGLVGESGSGKSTVGGCIAGLLKPDSGSVQFYGREKQVIFQDAAGSLNPRMTIGELVEEPLMILGKKKRSERKEQALRLLKMAGLGEEFYHRYPSDFSGGQQQRICIARALALEPDLLIADEPVSALDLSVQAQILNLFIELREEQNLSCLFISHDLGVVRSLSDRVAVMCRGSIVETGETEVIYENPVHPYTQKLLSAVLTPEIKIEKYF